MHCPKFIQAKAASHVAHSLLSKEDWAGRGYRHQPSDKKGSDRKKRERNTTKTEVDYSFPGWMRDGRPLLNFRRRLHYSKGAHRRSACRGTGQFTRSIANLRDRR